MVKRTISCILCIVLMLSITACGNGKAESNSSKADTILSNMTIEEKIAQTMMMDFRQWDSDGDGKAEDMTELAPDVEEILKEYGFGAVILFSENTKTTEDTFNLVMDMQTAASADEGIPMFIACDQEGGNVTRLGSGTALPGNMALGAADSLDDTREAGHIIGSELASLGINLDLAPSVDVNSNPSNPVIGLRAFGDNPEKVGENGAAFIEGLKECDVAGCAKHYPGHGDTAIDSHFGLPEVDKSYDELMKSDLVPFKHIIDSGADMIMTAHIIYPQIDAEKPATLSKKFISDILKDKLGFEGVVCTDGMNMQGIADNFGEKQAVAEALAAGADLICMPAAGITSRREMKRIDDIIEYVRKSVESGDIPEERLDDAVTGILKLKEKMGILEFSRDKYSLETAENTVGGKANREAESRLAADAVTVIRNEDNTIPYRPAKGEKVAALCAYENEIAGMAIGWNRAVKEKEAQFKAGTYDSDILKWADTVIVNSEDMEEERPLEILNYCRENGKKCIVMSCSLPYDVQKYMDADAVIAVYGCRGSSTDPTRALLEGTVSADDSSGPNITAGMEVIFGNYSASGKLPVNIYEYIDGQFTDKVVFERGFGLEIEK